MANVVRGSARPQSRLAVQSARAADEQSVQDSVLQSAYDNSEGREFNYTEASTAQESRKPWEIDQMAYFQKMQRGGLTQPHGVMICVEPRPTKLEILAYSSNAAELLECSEESVKLGVDARGLFAEASAMLLLKEAANKGTFRQPLVLTTKETPRPYYAVLTRCDLGVIVDIEPVAPLDKSLTIGTNDYLPKMNRDSPVAITMQEARHAAQISVERLKNLGAGNVQSVCAAVVREMRDLLQYDRVMCYKLHPDHHGEVVAESVRTDFDPYLGLHFPATDIPQAMRTLFIKVGSRMICNAARPMVKVIQAEEASKGLSLAESVLRAPHGCHSQYMVNMGSMASLVMAILVHDKKDDLDPNEEIEEGKKRLWGLLVCHHGTARYTAFPLRKAAEYLVNGFAGILNREVLLEANLHEENILRTQTLLCDMLESDVPLGIIREHPNIMDLVKCDGAALMFANRFWLLGKTPTELQIRDIVDWLIKSHGKKMAMCTESLSEAGFPGAPALGEAVCGMVAIRLKLKDFLFWFRSNAASEVKWSGRKHQAGEIDDNAKQHPRNSFKVFMDIVKKRSMPWIDLDLEAINGLRLMLESALDQTNSEELYAALDAGLKGAGGTNLNGLPIAPTKGLQIRLAHELPAALNEETEVVLRCFKASFLVTDGTREDYPVLFASEGFVQLSGYAAKDVVDKPFNILEGPDTDGDDVTKLKQAMSGGGTYNGRALHYRSDGHPFWNLVTMATVKDEDGNVRNHVLLFNEVAKYLETQMTPTSADKRMLNKSPSARQAPADGDDAGSPLTDRGFPVSIIRYEGRMKEKAVRKVLELVQAIKNPSKAKVDGPLTPGRSGGIAEELKVARPASTELPMGPNAFAQLGTPHGPSGHAPDGHPPAGRPRRRSVVEVLLGKQKDDSGSDSPVQPAPAHDVAKEAIEAAKKRRTHKGLDFGTTLERIEHSFLVTDPRLDENPVIFMSDEYIRLTEYSREEFVGGDLIIPEGQQTASSEIRKIKTAISTQKDVSVQILAYKHKSGRTSWVLYHLGMVRDTQGHVLYMVNVLKDCGSAQVNEADVKAFKMKAEAEASAVAEALRNLPNAAMIEKQWTIHSHPVLPKPHRAQDPAWTAVREMAERDGRLGLKHFRPIKPLGSGDSGSVVLAELRGTGFLFAVKVMEKENMIERNKVHRVAAEREILEHLDHPFLPTLYASYQTAKHVCFVTDFCKGGELYSILEEQPENRFDEPLVRFYAAEVLLALEYLHCQGVIYRDLKPENLLLTDGGHILLTDFDLSILTSAFPKVVRPGGTRSGGSSKRRKSKGGAGEALPMFVAEPVTRSNSFVGTEEYIAPEIVAGGGHSADVDWWAFGILIYEMLFGYTPFAGNSMRQTFSNVMNLELPFPSNMPVSAEAKHLIRCLLNRDPVHRLGHNMGSSEVKAHPFFNGINWALIRSKDAKPPRVPVKPTDVSAILPSGRGKAGTDTWRLTDIAGEPRSDRSSVIMLRSSTDSFPTSGRSSNEIPIPEK
uniref:non-specific serine/threonine protein kinase n=1 Tax=Cylindrocystis brebissonii TaxID=102167 RepID=A0A059UJW4_9VIRI|nr:neochrome 2 [Cylindrocystis brebissonii]|eukprot:TRINITY_DN13634_c0_g1_i1.p1 TRINITY_DN13634_c0_g1~~TRINITY_DN13634_c0_g1_i1.p1  ORF type:complete len:1505 (-),score=322.97 TRINITY_DN13634_c0_g1_i1:757-5271(-)